MILRKCSQGCWVPVVIANTEKGEVFFLGVNSSLTDFGKFPHASILVINAYGVKATLGFNELKVNINIIIDLANRWGNQTTPWTPWIKDLLPKWFKPTKVSEFVFSIVNFKQN